MDDETKDVLHAMRKDLATVRLVVVLVAIAELIRGVLWLLFT